MKIETFKEWADELSFEALSEEQQQMVTNVWTESAYRNWHTKAQLIRASYHNELESLTFNTSIPSSVQRALKNRQHVTPIWHRIFEHRIPTWAAVAAGFLLFFMIYDYPNQAESIAGKPFVKLVKDTVYIVRSANDSMLDPIKSKPIPSTRVRRVEWEIDTPQLASNDSVLGDDISQQQNHSENRLQPIFVPMLQKNGKSLKEDEIAQKILGLKL